MYMYTYSILFRLHTTTEIFILVECHKKVAPGVLGNVKKLTHSLSPDIPQLSLAYNCHSTSRGNLTSNFSVFFHFQAIDQLPSFKMSNPKGVAENMLWGGRFTRE